MYRPSLKWIERFLFPNNGRKPWTHGHIYACSSFLCPLPTSSMKTMMAPYYTKSSRFEWIMWAQIHNLKSLFPSYILIRRMYAYFTNVVFSHPFIILLYSDVALHCQNDRLTPYIDENWRDSTGTNQEITSNLWLLTSTAYAWPCLFAYKTHFCRQNSLLFDKSETFHFCW